MQVQEFMRKKAEREAVREAEYAAEKGAKEREIARLRAQQEKAQDQQAALDELNALRIQEEVICETNHYHWSTCVPLLKLHVS